MWDSLFGNIKKRVVMVGLPGTGKTTILYKMKLDIVAETTPTVGCNVEELSIKTIHSGYPSRKIMEVFDLSGQENYRVMWSRYFKGAHGIIIVLDSSDSESMATVKKILEDIMSDENTNKDAKILVMANKNDMERAMTMSEISKKLSLDSVISRDWYVTSCCALTGSGLAEGFTWLASKIK